MKTLKYLSMMLIMMTVTVCMSACGDDDDPSNSSNSIVGTWSTSGQNISINGHYGTLQLTFNSNSTGNISAIYDDGTDTDTYGFEYVLREEGGYTTITIVWTGTQALSI